MEEKEKVMMEQWIRESEIEALKWRIHQRQIKRKIKLTKTELDLSDIDLGTDCNLSETLINTQELLLM